MENASLVGLSRQVVLRRELDMISNNVANMNTSGFKAEKMAFGEYMMPKAREDTFERRSDRMVSFVEDLSTWHDQTAGAIQTTGGDTDFAISGDGFFVVEGGGSDRYTRNGAFQINSQGELVTSEGARVLSTSGPIQLGPNEHGLTVAADGTISTSEGVRGRLRVAVFANLQDMQKVGESTFSSTATPTEPTLRTKVVQGAIEKSNVRPVWEMSRLVEVTRAYENVTSLLAKQDEIRRSAIEKLAEVPS